MSTKFLGTKGGLIDAAQVIGCKVENPKGESLGKIEGLMLDLTEGRILYTVLSFGGFMGMGDKLFPVPVDTLTFLTNEKGALQRCLLDIPKETLKNAPGYEKDRLPSTADRT